MAALDPERAARRSALIAAIAASFLTPFLASSVNVALPSIGATLQMDSLQLSWVATAFLLTSAVCLVPFGRLADMVGRMKVFQAGMALFTLSSVACGFAWSASSLIAARALQGVGAAMIFGTGLAILSSVYPPGQRGRVLGFTASAVYFGLSVGPFVGGLLTRHWGWQSVFFASVPVGIVGLLVTWRGIAHADTAVRGGRFDAVGAIIYAFSLVALIGGLSTILHASGSVLAIAGCVGLVGFVAWERRVASPVLDVGLLARNAVFARSNFAALVNYAATYAVAFLLSLYCQWVRGFDPAHTGQLLLTQPVVMMAVSPFAGRLSDRVEPRIVASVGMILTVLGLLCLAALEPHTPVIVFISVLALLGIGFGLFSSPNTNAVMSAVMKSDYGVAGATLGTMRLLGQVVSMGFAAAALAWFVGRATITPAMHLRFMSAMRVVFLISAALCTGGVFASITRGNVRISAATPGEEKSPSR